MNRSRLALLTALGGATAVLLTACSSSSPADPTTSAADPSTSAAAQAPGGGAAGFRNPGFAPAATGVIAALAGRIMQVQSTTAQTAVTYSATTRFTQQQKTSLAAVKAGSCILATSATPGSSGSAAAPPADITATAVQLLGTGNSCGFGGRPGGGFGARPSGQPGSGNRFGGGNRPSGAPSGPRNGAAFAARVIGTVAGVSGSTITVHGLGPSGASATHTVTVTAATEYSTTASTTAKALKVGLCASAQGTTNSSGVVAARSIALSPKTGTTCTGGFGFGRGFGGGRGGTGG